MEEWILKRAYLDYREILKDFPLDEITAKLISKKKFTNKKEIYNYLNSDTSLLHDPFKLKGMSEAVSLIADDIENGNKILLSLDYDVDGIISGAITFLGLSTIGARCSYILPHRIKDGYGINERIIEYARENSVDTIITFDNGIAAFEPIKLAKNYGIKVIVTDHHDIPFTYDENQEKILNYVDADLIINPKQHDCEYPFKGICGGVIAYKLIEAIYTKLNKKSESLNEFIALAAIATICDVMELRDENRSIVYHGLKNLERISNPGLKELLNLYGIERKITSDDIGFKIGPCFNSSGRLSTASKSLDLLTLSNDEIPGIPEYLKNLAKELYELNQRRKDITKHAFEKAISLIEANKMYDENIILIYLEKVHESIAGIVASRVKERYNKPVIVFTDSEEIIKGSARSIESLDIFELISIHKEMLLKFGGHPMAAGMSIEKKNLNEFFDKLRISISEYSVPKYKTYAVDMILNFSQLNISLANSLKSFEPYGKGNEKMIFSSLKVSISDIKIIGKNSNVLKMKIKQNEIQREFICFSDIDSIIKKIGDKVKVTADYNFFIDENDTFDIIYTVGINVFNSTERLQLELISIR